MQFIPGMHPVVDHTTAIIVAAVAVAFGVFGALPCVLVAVRRVREVDRASEAYVQSLLEEAPSDRARQRIENRRYVIIGEWADRNEAPADTSPRLFGAALILAGAAGSLLIAAALVWSISIGVAYQNARQVTLDAYAAEIEEVYGPLEIDVDQLDFPVDESERPGEYTGYGSMTLRHVESGGAAIAELEVMLAWTGDRFGLYSGAKDGSLVELERVDR